MIPCYLRGETITPRFGLKQQPHANAYLLFDDTVLETTSARSNRRQCSGHAKRVIQGIGVVTCVYSASEPFLRD